MAEFGGENVKILDSNEMWQDPDFRARFSEEYQSAGPPPRALLFTTDELLTQLAVSLKWSVDGTHRIAPRQFSQLFITMMKVGDKWLPSVLGLLANHEASTYQLYIEMIKYTLDKMGLQVKVESVMSDFTCNYNLS